MSTIKQVLRNCDDFFEYDEISGIPCQTTPTYFSTSIFVYKPCVKTFEKLLTTTQGLKEGRYGIRVLMVLSLIQSFNQQEMGLSLAIIFNFDRERCKCAQFLF
jgi:hypothetical protein